MNKGEDMVRTLLVVERDRDICEFIRAGFRAVLDVRVASGASAAIQCTDVRPVHLVLMDLMRREGLLSSEGLEK